MEPEGPGAGASRTRTRGALARAARSLLPTPPERRVWRTRRGAVGMLVCGLGTIAGMALVAYGGAQGEAPLDPPWLPWYLAGGGVASALLGLADLLVGRPGARRAVVALRTVTQACFVGLTLGWAWEAANGSGLAALALAFGCGCAAVAHVVGRAGGGS